MEEHAVPGGISVNIPTSSPGYEAALRMVPQHVALLAMPEWSTNVTISSAGVLLTITAAGHEVDHIRALGFFGVMATQSHHQEHHLMLALGQPMP